MEELLEAEDAALATCSGKKCTANEHCCEDHVCIDDNECKFELLIARRNVNFKQKDTDLSKLVL